MVARPQISREAIDRIRAKIDGARIVNRLQAFALGTPVMVMVNGEPQFHIRFEDGTTAPGMTKEQITAAKILLDKIVPTPQSLEVNSQETRTFVIRAPEPAKDVDQWLREFGPKTIEHQEKEHANPAEPAERAANDQPGPVPLRG